MERSRRTEPGAQLLPEPARPPSAEPSLILVASSSFENNHPIPLDYTRDGEDFSPRLSWANVPPLTRSLAVLCEDPDASKEEPFVHWLIYNIPRVSFGVPLYELPKGVSRVREPQEVPGAVQGRNDFGEVGYGGPEMPKGPAHHYRFKVYALDAPLDLREKAGRDDFLAAIQGHVKGVGELVGIYGRAA